MSTLISKQLCRAESHQVVFGDNTNDYILPSNACLGDRVSFVASQYNKKPYVVWAPDNALIDTILADSSFIGVQNANTQFIGTHFIKAQAQTALTFVCLGIDWILIQAVGPFDCMVVKEF